ncbi:hypothetical protein BIY27_11505 [Gibbsiella quercinecans]|nr:hypothetical protein BIY27_11505 [Gibbsiella quercinecans]
MHVYAAWIRMIEKGSKPIGRTSNGAPFRYSCTCMKTNTKSGQAWRGYDCARRGLLGEFHRK